MPSERAIGADRRNAQATTGPRTVSGEQRSAQNARSHGLSVVQPDAAADEEVTRLAELIASEHAGVPEVAYAARTFAEAQVSFLCITAVKSRWLREEMETKQADMTPGDWLTTFPSSSLLQRLERCERRAFSRRKSAARRLELSTTLGSLTPYEPGH